MRLYFKPVWFDSLGAKSSCTWVETPDVKIIIDPGIAVMQPSFPASMVKKIWWVEMGSGEIKKACREAEILIITHYHYDHYFPEDLDIYKGKIVIAKNPNEYINDSQRVRALEFYEKIFRKYGKVELEKVAKEAEVKEYPNPMLELKISSKKDFGDYNKRRLELLKLGYRFFEKMVKEWNKEKKIPEVEFKDIKIRWADGAEFKFGKTRIKFTKPLFHGIEFSRVGWVVSVIIEYKNEKLFYSSDLNGPLIEDYAQLIIDENPDILILDGPATYMIPYTLNLINFRRAVENAKKIIKKVESKVILYDHHLPRERKFRERTREVWEMGKRLDKKVLTVAEFLGKMPVVLTL
ncbi:MAG: MBL fold metallo-hydrolase [Candidatus Methanomethyliales bacterium]|nr:MBL fold metallo-hydrolase [Candidatus Methanomethylicales archaeon]